MKTTIEKVKKNSKVRKEKSYVRDNTKYKFNDKICTKSGLVLEMFRAIIDKYDWRQLAERFANVPTPYPILAPKSTAEKISVNYRRYFINKENVLVDMNGKKICVTNQWGSGNINEFIKIYKQNFVCQLRTIKQESTQVSINQ